MGGDSVDVGTVVLIGVKSEALKGGKENAKGLKKE